MPPLRTGFRIFGLLMAMLLISLEALSDDGTIQWTYLTGGIVHSTPSIGPDGTIYVGSYDTRLYALNPDGTLLWTFETGDALHSSPAVGSDGTIYFGSRDTTFYALNPDGSLKWQYATGGEVNSSPAVGIDDTIYFGSNDGYLYALSADGTEQWRFKTIDDEAVQSSPAIGSDRTIYFGSDEMRLYALDINGGKKWDFQANSMIRSSPAVDSDGTIYVGSYDDILYAINSDGSKKWEFKTQGVVHSSPAIGDDGTIYIGSYDYMLYAVNPNGSMKWKFPTQGVVFGSPAVGNDGMVYITSQDKKLYAVNPDGTYKWHIETNDLLRSSPVMGQFGVVYVGSRDRYLYAVETTYIPDNTPPEVRFTDPSDEETDVAVDIIIAATFSEAVNQLTMTTDSFLISDGTANIQGTVTGNDASFIFTPEESLFEGHTYTAALTTDIEDLAGNRLADTYIWTFTTMLDLCPDDPAKDDPGICGCGIPDADSDSDGVLDCNDAFPEDPEEWADTDGDGFGNNEDLDDDDDGMPDTWEETFGLDPLNGDDAAGDADGDGETNLDEYLAGTDPTHTPEEGIYLFPGWNLVSLYVAPTDDSIETVLAPIAGMYDSVWAFVNGDWQVYDPASPEFSNLNSMTAGYGYWIKMTEQAFLSIQGEVPQAPVEIQVGWNLVGYNAVSAQSAGDAMASIDGSYLSVWGFISDTWRLYDPVTPEFSNLTEMAPGRGYWVQASEPCSWLLP